MRQLFMLLAFIISASDVSGQEALPRIMRQDSTVNNLVDPSGYVTAPLGTLGAVTVSGSGAQPVILIPGLGFGAEIFTEFIAGLGEGYTVYAVTLPGFGGTAAPPLPAPDASFREQTWTNGTLNAIEALIKEQSIKNPIVVGHWLTGTQLALRLAMNHPDNVKAVVLLSGSARMMVADSLYERHYGTLEKRVAAVDRWLSPRWFKTVTRETWDDNNFLPSDYAVNPVRALRLWREAASPKLHVWIRYLCEFNAQDISFDIHMLKVPTLLLKPGLEGIAGIPDQKYLYDYCHRSWEGILAKNPKIVVRTIPDTRVCLWFDKPLEVRSAIRDFLQGVRDER